MNDYWQRRQMDTETASAECHPERIFQLARRSPAVKAHVQAWRAGAVTWEGMLVALVTQLADHNEKLASAALKSLQFAPFRTHEVPE